jgi:hypothetical protein
VNPTEIMGGNKKRKFSPKFLSHNYRSKMAVFQNSAKSLADCAERSDIPRCHYGISEDFNQNFVREEQESST